MMRANYLAFGTAALLAVAIADDLFRRARKRGVQPQSLSANDLLNASGMQASAAQQAALNPDASPVTLSARMGHVGQFGFVRKRGRCSARRC